MAKDAPMNRTSPRLIHNKYGLSSIAKAKVPTMMVINISRSNTILAPRRKVRSVGDI